MISNFISKGFFRSRYDLYLDLWIYYKISKNIIDLLNEKKKEKKSHLKDNT